MSRNLTLALLLFSAGCMADAVTPADEPPPDTTPPTTMPPPTTNPPVDTIVPSNNARVRFKGGQRFAAALASGLELAPTEVCQELSQYDCVDVVHNIALGGIEPYRNGIVEPLPETTVTTPIAADRVALAACTTRAEKDFADLPNAKIFAGLTVSEGTLADVDDASVEAVIQRLYQRLVTRDATAEEVEALRGLYREMAATPTADLAEAWAAVSCYAIASTMEALFY